MRVLSNHWRIVGWKHNLILAFLVRYGLALAATLLALLVRAALDPALRETQPLAVFFLAVAVSAWLGGLGPGLFSIVLGMVLGSRYFIEPRGISALSDPQTLARIIVALVVNVLLCLIIVRLRQARQREVQAEGSLRESENLWRNTFENAAIGITHLGPAGEWLRVNQTLCDLLGYRREELLGKTLEEITHPDDWAAEREPFARLMRGELDRLTLEKRYFRKDGHVIWALVSRTLQRDGAGRPVYAISIVQDITDRKLEEMERARLAAIVSSSHDAIFSKTVEGIILSWNAAAERMYGYTAEEMIGHSIAEIVPPERLDELAEILARLRRGERIEQHETERVRKDGRRIQVSVTISPIRDAGGRVVAESIIARDITAQRAAETVNEASLAQLEAIIGSMREALVIADLNGNMLKLNPAALRMHGFATAEEACLHLEEYPQLFEVAELEDLEGGPLPAEAWPIARAIRGEVFANREYRVRRRDTGRQWIGSYSGTPVRNRTGMVTLAIVTIRDVTGQREDQDALRAANERLAEADRRKDEFPAMLAHELRNPLAPIRYAVQLLQLTGDENPQLKRQREIIDRQINHMGRLLDDLLDVTRITRGKIQLRREELDLRAVAGHAVESMRSLFEERRQQLVFQAPSAALPVNGDPTRLEQVMRNLLHNATKYTEPGGCVSLMVGLEARGERAWSAVVRVRDSGVGIAPEMLGHVFEPFVQAEQSLARTQGGLGIGLSMVKSLVELHGGEVAVHSEGHGQGSEFIVRLPLSNNGEVAGPQGLAARLDGPGAAPDSRRVLVVDDNEDAAAALAELLALWGHRVQTAHDGPAALAAAQEWQPEVILLDIGLPGMDGYEVAGRLRREPDCGGALIVALTGYGGEEDRRRALEAGFDRHFTKPVAIEQLKTLLRQAHAA